MDKRQRNLDEDLNAFPYVNGDLFGERLRFADFNKDMRSALLECCHFNWAKVSPAVFGSMFQGVMDDKERRQIGGHYTSERDILKLIGSLFLDDLKTEFEHIKTIRSVPQRLVQFKRFHKKLASLKFLDPACGCGNFLVISYREIRKLETDLLKEITIPEQVENIATLSVIDVDNFYGIEIGEWPARIAEVALWLMDHQMNKLLAEAFHLYFVRLPLKKSPHIQVGNALRLDWQTILPAKECSYVLGNPPFVGKHLMTPQQKEDMGIAWGMTDGGINNLDYVTCWYKKAAEYIQGTDIRCAFVSTNSITQGEQVPVLAYKLFFPNNLKIHFAHRTFAWESEARGKAHVHVVIIGFSLKDVSNKRIYDYEPKTNKMSIITATNINNYLIDGKNIVIPDRTNPICDVPLFYYGNKPTDGGYLLLDDQEKRKLEAENPSIMEFIKPFLGAVEFLNGLKKWCFWLKDIPPEEYRHNEEIRRRLAAVKAFRLASKKSQTRNIANLSMLFGEIRQPTSSYILIPRVTSENRQYIPMAFFDQNYIVGDTCSVILNPNLYHFGILTSSMHMAWMRQLCGRLESRYRYSGNLVYNNYPWPLNPKEKQIKNVEEASKEVLDVRTKFSISTLADLYDPLYMPADLLKAHQKLDKAVEKCYRGEAFHSDRERVEFLFNLYQQITAPFDDTQIKKKRKKINK